MKKIIFLTLLSFSFYALHSQNYLEKEGLYFGFNDIPNKEKVSFTTNFKLNTQNHPLDSIKGSIASIFSANPSLTIKQENIGRIVFYAKNKVENDSLYNDNVINGSINIKYIRREADGSAKTKMQEDINLRSNWVEYHKYLKIPGINEVLISFVTEMPQSQLIFDKLKITSLSEDGISFYDSQIKNEQILLSTVNNSNYNKQSEAIKVAYEQTIIPTLFAYRENVTNILSFDEGRNLGQTKSALLNPFEYDFFNTYFQGLKEKADYSQKLELENIKNDVDNNNWLDVAGNIVNILTGGTFSPLINVITNVVSEQIIKFDDKDYEIRKISSRFYVNKKGTIKTLSSIVEEEKEQKSIITKYNENLVENDDHFKFLSRIQNLRALEIENKKKFAINYANIKAIKVEIDKILIQILKESNTDANINDFYITEALVGNLYSLYFRDNYNASVNTVDAFIDKKIQFSIINTQYKVIIKEIEDTMSETKTLYDNSFTTNSLDKNIFNDISKNKDISSEWQESTKNLENTYLTSSLLKRLKSITKMQ